MGASLSHFKISFGIFSMPTAFPDFALAITRFISSSVMGQLSMSVSGVTCVSSFTRV